MTGVNSRPGIPHPCHVRVLDKFLGKLGSDPSPIYHSLRSGTMSSEGEEAEILA